MKFGMSNIDYQRWRQQWHTAFAWFPQEMSTGKWIWLQKYEWTERKSSTTTDWLPFYREFGSNYSPEKHHALILKRAGKVWGDQPPPPEK